MMDRLATLSERFDTLLQLQDKKRRGYLFERLVASVFERDRFRIVFNPTAARPRQTDLIAIKENATLLVETKWLERKIGSAEIASLRDRLSRVPHDILGCFISMSDFATTAIAEAERDRGREILLFSASEIAAVVYRRVTMERLVEEKRSCLRTRGRIWFYEGKNTAELRVPVATESILRNGAKSSHFGAPTWDFPDFVFSFEMPYVSTKFGHTAFGINERLEIESIAELEEVFNAIEEHLSLSSHGTYSISQMDYSWHGFGVSDFIAQLKGQEERYLAAHELKRIHHSEELAYFDRISLGTILITGRQTVRTPRFLHDMEVEIRLGAIPLSLDPFIRLAKTLSLGDISYSIVPETQATTYHHDIFPRRPLKIVAAVQSTTFWGDPSIAGYIVVNPFYRDVASLNHKQSTLDAGLKRIVCGSKLLLLHLRDWINVGDQVDVVDFHRIEAMWAGHVPVIWATGTWRNLVKRAPTESADERFERVSKSVPDAISSLDDVLAKLKTKSRNN